MGTQCVFIFSNGTRHAHKDVAIIRDSFDGFYSEWGIKLAEFLCPMRLVNGYRSGVPNQANGMGCLAAQFISKYKKDVGGLYLSDSESIDWRWVEYAYRVIGNDMKPDGLIVIAGDSGEQRFEGTPIDFLTFCKNNDE